MPQYLSPGVYVEEVPSAIKPIAGVSTSTAAFIGIVPASFPIPPSFAVVNEKVIADGTARLPLKNYPVSEAEGTYAIRIPGSVAIDCKIENNHDEKKAEGKKSYVKPTLAPSAKDDIRVTYFYPGVKTIENAKSRLGGTGNTSLDIDFQSGEPKPASVEAGSYKIRIKNQQGEQPASGATLTKVSANKYSIQFEAEPSLEGTDSIIVEYRLQAKDEPIGVGNKDGQTTTFDLKNAAAAQAGATVTLNGNPHTLFQISSEGSKSRITLTKNVPQGTEIAVDYQVGGLIKGERVSGGGQESALLKLSDYPVLPDPKTFQVWVNNEAVDNVEVIPRSGNAPSYLKFTNPPKGEVRADYTIFATFRPAPVGDPVLCTSFSEYRRHFGDFSPDLLHSYLTHAVYGFFNNGGTRCYVVRAKDATPTEIHKVFDALDRVEDISMVVAPGLLDDGTREVIVSRCATKGDRFAIFDGPEKEPDLNRLIKIRDAGGVMPKRTDVAAWYFPWIRVFDPVTKMLNPGGDGAINVPPSGHIAGIYARVDSNRGVHKAPANEPVLGALGVAQALSKAEQDGLNPKGVNCIRVINDSILLWGARTVGGDLNTDLKYINVKRTMLFLKKSIYEGTQWVVFEPNSPALWQTINRNVTAFLTSVWRSGALFGNTPQEAFYVKCDAETNPKEAREAGQVVTEIGVAIIRPAEFVIFRISQWAGPGQ
jgi:uncharacterized protein